MLELLKILNFGSFFFNLSLFISYTLMVSITCNLVESKSICLTQNLPPELYTLDFYPHLNILEAHATCSVQN